MKINNADLSLIFNGCSQFSNIKAELRTLLNKIGNTGAVDEYDVCALISLVKLSDQPRPLVKPKDYFKVLAHFTMNAKTSPWYPINVLDGYAYACDSAVLVSHPSHLENGNYNPVTKEKMENSDYPDLGKIFETITKAKPDAIVKAIVEKPLNDDWVTVTYESGSTYNYQIAYWYKLKNLMKNGKISQYKGMLRFTSNEYSFVLMPML